jgi:predicted lipoprotein with Yx(FWY)xxD motif
MRTKHRFGAAAAVVTSPWLVAAAALATLAATIFLLHPPATQAAESAGPMVTTAKTGLGRILVNSSGRTLYLFGKDRNGKSACTGQCAAFWPPLIANASPRAAGGARTSLIGTTRRTDGRLQVTYNHHPLYMFAKDKKKGQTNGEELSAFGAKWYAVSTAGGRVLSHSTAGGGGNPYP